MIRRPLWLGTGVAIGVGGTLWTQRRARQAMARLAPDHVARRAVGSAQSLGVRARHAYGAAQEERRRQESALRRATDRDGSRRE